MWAVARFDDVREALRADSTLLSGVHRCAGAHLANLEMGCLLDAMARKVNTIEVGGPTPFPSNMLSGFASLPSSFS